MSMIIDNQEVLDIRGKSQLSPMNIALAVAEYNGFTATDLPLCGIYYVWATENCYLKHNTAIGQTACTAANGIMLNARTTIDMRIQRGDVISALTETAASGVLRFILIRAEY